MKLTEDEIMELIDRAEALMYQPAERLTVDQMKERRESWRTWTFYVAETDDRIYVADSLMVTVWDKQGPLDGTPLKASYWGEVAELEGIDGLIFVQTECPLVGFDFHRKANILITMLNLMEGYAYCWDCKPKHIWYYNGLANGFEFDLLGEEVIDDLQRMLKKDDESELLDHVLVREEPINRVQNAA